MKKLLFILLMVITLLSSCHRGVYILIQNIQNDSSTVYCYFDFSRIDTISVHPNDSSLLFYHTSPFISWKKIPDLYVSHIDSIKIQTKNKTTIYRNKEFIYDFLMNNKDTANIIKTRVLM